MSAFARALVHWQVRYGRHGLPWQATRDPYRIWLSEVMLQQTQVATVIPYFERFVARFPDVESLARATLDEVLALWSGLGYYSRARNLHVAARVVVESCRGRLPRTREDLASLPGVGRSTAAAIAVFAFGAREAILDGNVKRVLARHFAVRGYPGDRRVESRLWKIAEEHLPARNIERYTQALMDLGASLCTRRQPACASCPLRSTCKAHAAGKEDTYPEPRPRKVRVFRKTSMLLILRAGEILLEKRPPTGVWGGLWCLPEMSFSADARAFCRRRFGASLARVERLPLLRHGFTHFTLEVAPVVCHLETATACAAEPGQVWLPLDKAPQAAVPAPLRKLLLALKSA